MLALTLFSADLKHIVVYVVVALVIIAIVWYAMRGRASA